MSKEAAEIFNKYAREYMERFMDVSLYHDSLDEFCHNISNQNARVLELACGPGNITHYLLQQRPHLKITGTDLAPNMVELAKANNPTAVFFVMDSRNTGTLKETYEAVMCGFCMPYLSKTEAIQLITDCSKLLLPKGIIYISTMLEDEKNQSGWQTGSKGDPMYMNFHQSAYLKNALNENGFSIIKDIQQDFPSKEEKRYTDLILIAVKD